MVSRAGRMSSISSHFESRSVEILTRRSRVLSHPSGDSMSVAIVPLSSAMGDSETANTLATIRSYFNIDSTMITRRLVEVRKNYFISLEYELHVPLPGECPYDAFSCGFSLSTDALELFNLGKMKSDGEAGSGSAAPSVANALLYSKECWGVYGREVPYLQCKGALHPTLAKQVYECSSEELMNRVGNVGQELAGAAERQVKEMEAEIERMRTELESLRSQRREFEQEVGLLCSSLDGAWNDRACLEGDVLSLTLAATFLKAEL
ncbi:hypothetical protein BHM03_00049377 [Ensete ventricosum]|nr:hypothetical protein BHM03_00049377 [Ensete ventricosum]